MFSKNLAFPLLLAKFTKAKIASHLTRAPSAILSIEKELVEKLDYVNLINTFASKNARRVIFK